MTAVFFILLCRCCYCCSLFSSINAMSGIIYHAKYTISNENPGKVFAMWTPLLHLLLLLLSFRKISFGIVWEKKSAAGVAFCPKTIKLRTEHDNANGKSQRSCAFCLCTLLMRRIDLDFLQLFLFCVVWKKFFAVAVRGGGGGCAGGRPKKVSHYQMSLCWCLMCFNWFDVLSVSFLLFHALVCWFFLSTREFWRFETCAKCDTFNLFYKRCI